ncbi:Hypothetical protein SRAE_2000122100 [Strongyloides ratti]|uniref:Uncharacterized protein n=1 Tax=Strongyloides ratti TaxID=34506 RepID=A0A090LEI0_STRRB|nr:Hypothetical protein SRAE_2000122100 [Strongyloides ratti]CEF66553.1 Hypothetical protein SRAE_2000122100 [Strongyloides ratti]
MENSKSEKKGKVIKGIEKSLFVHKDDKQTMDAKGGIRARKLFKPLPPAKQIEEEALAAKKAQELKELEEKEREEASLKVHEDYCEEVHRVAFEYDIKLIDLFDEMINVGMGSEINKIFENNFYPKLGQLMRRDVTDLDKKFIISSLLDSNVMKLTKNQICGLSAKEYFKNIGNLLWREVKNYEGDEVMMEKIKTLIKRKLELTERINELKNNK